MYTSIDCYWVPNRLNILLLLHIFSKHFTSPFSGAYLLLNHSWIICLFNEALFFRGALSAHQEKMLLLNHLIVTRYHKKVTCDIL